MSGTLALWLAAFALTASYKFSRIDHVSDISLLHVQLTPWTVHVAERDTKQLVLNRNFKVMIHNLENLSQKFIFKAKFAQP